MTPSIYSGLSNYQAFALMNAQLMLSEELPALNRWNTQRHWRVAGWWAAIFAAVATVVALAIGASTGITATSAAGACSLVAAIASLEARSTRKRLTYLLTLKIGLEQFKSAAQQAPGASSAELLSLMPDAPAALPR